MQKRMRKIIAVFMLMTILFAVAVSQSFLYFTNRTEAENVITYGSVDVQVIENTLDESGREITYRESGAFNLMRESDPDRIIYAKNNGEHPIFVRAKLEIHGKQENGRDFVLSDEYVSFDINTKDWEDLYSDGWYYYTGNTTGVLEPDMTSEELMTKIIFEIDELQNDYNGSELTLTVYVSAVQSENNGPTVYDAEGWPEEGD